MKGRIVASTAHRKNVSENYLWLWGPIQKEYGFEFQWTDDPEIPPDLDILIVSHQRTYNNSMMNLEHLDPKIKMIGKLGDIHSLDLWHGNGTKMLARYDVIMTTQKEAFTEWYPQFAHKFIWLPTFFAPHEQFVNIPFNENPIPKCLISGATWPEHIYPLRHYVANACDAGMGRGMFDCLQYPGSHFNELIRLQPEYFFRAKYAHALNAYLCCLGSTVSHEGEVASTNEGNAYHKAFNTVVLKNIEIPAVGSLLLTERCADLEDMGFVPYEHYIPVTIENVFEVVEQALDGRFDHVRRAGMEMVHQNHSVNNRLEQMRGIIDEVYTASKRED